MSEDGERAIKEAERKGAEMRRNATEASAPQVIQKSINTILTPILHIQGTREWDLECCMIAANKVPKVEAELGIDHPLTRAWRTNLEEVSKRLMAGAVKRALDAI